MSRYLLTGVTGYIGSMLARELTGRGEAVTAIVREGSCLQPSIAAGVEIILADITDKAAISGITGAYDYLIHCAAPTKSAYMISHPAEVTDSIVNGTYHMLELAERFALKSMVYLSSMEVYGQVDCSGGRRITEEETGRIDVASVRSCYPLAKLMAENLCHSFHKEYGVPVKIARLAQTFGRGIRPDDTRIFAQFARAVKSGSDIVLHTRGSSMGNYCDIDDAVAAILFILFRGENSQCYNVVNEANTMTVRQMAQLVADEIAGGGIRVRFDISAAQRYGYAADTGLRLSGSKLRRLGFEPHTRLHEMYERMLQSMETDGR